MLFRISASGTIALILAACGSPPSESPIQEAKRSDPTPTIPHIEGNEAHNLLAGYSEFERAGALAALVKQLTGKPRCSIERAMYQGSSHKNAIWSVACHDGTDFQVLINADGSGGVMPCAVGAAVAKKRTCWRDFSKPEV